MENKEEKEKKEPKKVSKKEFTELVGKGFSVKELAEYYTLSDDSIRKILTTLGLKCKKKVQPKFELIDDLEEFSEKEQVAEKTEKLYFWEENLQNKNAKL